MPLCGFNSKMLEGLVKFHEGLVEHGLIERSKIRGQSIEQTFEKEFSDMDRFLAEIMDISGPEMKALIESITKYTMAFYKLIKREGIKDYQKTIGKLNNFYVEMDRKYYSDLEGKSDDMKQLVNHLNCLNL